MIVVVVAILLLIAVGIRFIPAANSLVAFLSSPPQNQVAAPANASTAPPQEQRQAPRPQKTPEEQAAEHAKYVARYVTSRNPRDTNGQTVAIAVVSEKAKYNQAIAAAVSARCKPERLKFPPSPFTLEFVSDGLFENAFNGSTAIIRDLELTNSADLLLLGRQSVEYATNPDLNNLITATMRLELNALPVGAWGQNNGWTFSANGAGFRQADARAAAEERIVKQISGTNFNLAPLSSGGQ
jgi:hypothetical protein